MSLQLKDIGKTVNREIYLKDINLELQSGARYVVLGRTLAGKTTLLRIMAGLDKPTRGAISFDGHDVTGVTVRKRNVSMVYQQFINYPSLTIYKNIAAPLNNRNLGSSEIDEKVRRVAAMLHIDPLLDRLPAELSGGQQQRTAIARALVKESPLLLMDEPLVNLDYKLREELRDELRQIFEERESIVVYTTTEPSEALMIGGNIIVMDQGRVLQSGPTTDVYARPANTRVAEVFSDPPINFVTTDVSDNQASLRIGITFPLSGHLTGLPPGRYTFGIRPHHIFLSPRSDHDVRIDSTVELAEINGSETFIHVRYRDRSLVVQEQGVHSYRVGSEVAAFAPPSNFYVFDEAGSLVKAPTGHR